MKYIVVYKSKEMNENNFAADYIDDLCVKATQQVDKLILCMTTPMYDNTYV